MGRHSLMARPSDGYFRFQCSHRKHSVGLYGQCKFHWNETVQSVEIGHGKTMNRFFVNMREAIRYTWRSQMRYFLADLTNVANLPLPTSTIPSSASIATEAFSNIGFVAGVNPMTFM